MRPIRRDRNQSGTQLVEFALILPLLLFLVLSITEGARFVRIHQVINNAAREGAHASAYPQNKGKITDITQLVIDYAARNGVTITAGNVTVNQGALITTSSGLTRTASQVQVVYTYTLQYMPKLPWFKVKSTVPLKGSAEFQNFYLL